MPAGVAVMTPAAVLWAHEDRFVLAMADKDPLVQARRAQERAEKEFLRHCLLTRLRVDDVLVFVNLRPHRRKDVRQLASAVGVRVVYCRFLLTRSM